jgi:hypothetical protein
MGRHHPVGWAAALLIAVVYAHVLFELAAVGVVLSDCGIDGAAGSGTSTSRLRRAMILRFAWRRIWE